MLRTEMYAALFDRTQISPSALQRSVIYSALVLHVKLAKRILSQLQKQYIGSHKLREDESPLDDHAPKT